MRSERDWQEYRERRDRWRGVPLHERDRLVLEAIGAASAPVTLPEVVETVERALLGSVDGAVSFGTVHAAAQRLLAAGEVDRLPVQPGTHGEKPGTRWRWARRMPADLISELEAAFSAPSAHADRPDSGATS